MLAGRAGRYGLTEFREDLRKLTTRAGVEGRQTVFLVTDAHLVSERFVEDINSLLGSGEVPNLFPPVRRPASRRPASRRPAGRRARSDASKARSLVIAARIDANVPAGGRCCGCCRCRHCRTSTRRCSARCGR